MAVLWAGEMSKELGVLEGQGLELHQSFVYLFNRHGGFTFAPLRKLCEKLNVDVEELVEGVLKEVRRDTNVATAIAPLQLLLSINWSCNDREGCFALETQTRNCVTLPKSTNLCKPV